MKTTLLFIIALCIRINVSGGFSNAIYDPFPSKENAKKIIERTLIIEKREIDDKLAKKLEKKNPEQLQFEKEYNDFFNTTLVDNFHKSFIGSKEIQLKTTKEVEEILSSKSDKYAIIRSGNIDRSFKVSGQTKYKETFTFSLYLSDSKSEQLMISFNSDILTDVDFVFLLQQINSNLNRAVLGIGSIEMNDINSKMAGKLKSKKLIITDKILGEDLSMEAISKEYTLETEYIKDNQKYFDIITNKTPGYAYITSTFLPLTWGTCYFVVDAETGDILEAISAGGVTFAIGMRPTKEQMPFTTKLTRNKYAIDLFTIRPKDELKLKHIKYFNKYAIAK